MNEEYYVLEEGEKKGPFSFNELVGRGIDIDTQVMINEHDGWQNASYLPEFVEYFENQGYYFPTEDNLAGAGRRTLAFIIDSLIVSGIACIIDVKSGLITLPTSPSANPMTYMNTLPAGTLMNMEINFAVVYLIYNSLFEITGARGAIGKMLCRLKVVDDDGRKVSILKALMRNIGSMLSFMLYFLPFLTYFFSQHKQVWYERLTKTYVIKSE